MRRRHERCATARRAFTILEALVVLAILGIVALVVGLAAPALDDSAVGSLQAAQEMVLDARRRAVKEGVAVRLTVGLHDSAGGRWTTYAVTALPDGGVIGDPALGVSRLTGAVDRGAKP